MKTKARHAAEKRRVLKRTKRTVPDLQDACFDPLGSYPGVCADKDDMPVQDADDL